MKKNQIEIPYVLPPIVPISTYAVYIAQDLAQLFHNQNAVGSNPFIGNLLYHLFFLLPFCLLSSLFLSGLLAPCAHACKHTLTHASTTTTIFHIWYMCTLWHMFHNILPHIYIWTLRHHHHTHTPHTYTRTRICTLSLPPPHSASCNVCPCVYAHQ